MTEATPQNPWQSPISPIHLDRPALVFLLTPAPKYHFQMLALTLGVHECQDSNWGSEDAHFRDAGTRVAKSDGRRGVHGEGGDFGDGVPC